MGDCREVVLGCRVTVPSCRILTGPEVTRPYLFELSGMPAAGWSMVLCSVIVIRLGLVPWWMFRPVLVETSMSHYFPGKESPSRTGVCYCFCFCKLTLPVLVEVAWVNSTFRGIESWLGPRWSGPTSCGRSGWSCPWYRSVLVTP